MKTIQGDLINLTVSGHFDVIVHGCNCFCAMGKGIAFQIKNSFPEAWKADLKTVRSDHGKLGGYSFIKIKRGDVEFIVVNMYTQYEFWGPGIKVNYQAVRSCFRKLKQQFTGYRIGYPKIGAGLARGDWGIIQTIIDEELEGEDHTLVLFE